MKCEIWWIQCHDKNALFSAHMAILHVCDYTTVVQEDGLWKKLVALFSVHNVHTIIFHFLCVQSVVMTNLLGLGLMLMIGLWSHVSSMCSSIKNSHWSVLLPPITTLGPPFFIHWVCLTMGLGSAFLPYLLGTKLGSQARMQCLWLYQIVIASKRRNKITNDVFQWHSSNACLWLHYR